MFKKVRSNHRFDKLTVIWILIGYLVHTGGSWHVHACNL